MITWNQTKSHVNFSDEVQIGPGIRNLVRLVGVSLGITALFLGGFIAFDTSISKRGSYPSIVLSLIFGGMSLLVACIIATKIADCFRRQKRQT